MNLSELNPRTIMLAGDWHANTQWALSCVQQAAQWLDGEDHKIIVQLGDFGVWGGGDHAFRVQLGDEAARLGVTVVFVRGNHEDHPLLSRLAGPGDVAEIGTSIFWARDGARWDWQGHSWLALGGAVSPDRAVRREGVTWFREEEIDITTAGMVALGGHADVMVTHDCPSGVHHSFGPRPAWWDARDIRRCEWHAELLQEVVNHVTPSWLFHGHLHRGYVRTVAMTHGPVMVCGLDMDGSDLNVAILDTATMDFMKPEETE